MNHIFFAYLHSSGISQKKLTQIFEEDIDPSVFFESLSDKTLSPYFPNTEQRNKIIETKAKLDTAFIEKIFWKLWVHIISILDAEYPENLRNISNPPFLLYVKWTLDNSPKIGVIGSRKMTSYGEKTIQTLIPPLANSFTIVSGGAIWCDTNAHMETLKFWGKTIVVVGTWIDKVYPAPNAKLYDDVVAWGGAIVSIFPLWEGPQMYNFPIRNEVIAGLSNGVLVIEAGEKSGTLITAWLALEQGRDLFAVPWDIYKTNSFGCNNLIKKWEAKMVTGVNDILEEYNFSLVWEKNIEKPNFSNKTEESIYNLLVLESRTIDELAQKISLETSQIAIALSLLEIWGLIKKTKIWKYEVC